MTSCVAWLAFLMLLPAECPEYDHIIDDQHGAPQFTLTGDDWATWGTNGCGYSGADTSYHYTSKTVGGPDKKGTATWKPNLPAQGMYEITTWFRKTGNRSTDANHFVYDGKGGITEYIIDQKADSPPEGVEDPSFVCGSGWYPLGTHFCNAGKGGCYVVLDANDDDQSDEANAVRFTLLECTGEVPPDPPVDTCEFPGEGPHEVKVFANKVVGNGWENTPAAQGEPDGAEAHSPNVEQGEILTAEFPELCDPDGEETIDKVELAIKLRTQYDSGPYDIVLKFHGGGAAQMTTHHTAAKWDVLDITGDKDSWTWAATGKVKAALALDHHPGGKIDADVWVDSFRLTVYFTTAAKGCPEGQVKCNGDTLEICQDSQWTVSQICDFGCLIARGACAGAPRIAEPEPDARTAPEPDAGLPPDDAPASPADTSAVPGDGGTVPAGPEGCVPFAKRCSGDKTIEICAGSGQDWEFLHTCEASQLCMNGICYKLADGGSGDSGCAAGPKPAALPAATLLTLLLFALALTARATRMPGPRP